MNKRTILSAAFGVTVAGALLAPAPAAACGGFFCNASQPVNQQAERIIFAQQADGSVTAVIQIQYQGPSESFAWMLPVKGSPEVGVSSNSAFDRLQAASNPSYQLTTRVEGTCRDERVANGGGARAAPSADQQESFDGAQGAAPPVTVVASGSVGPYDYMTISVDPTTSDVVTVALEWLRDNGYDVPELSADVLRPYLEQKMNLIAFRLTKGNDAGAIRPVTLSFGKGLPSIPIRPTAVAAQPDMGILVWVLGEHRAVPANYRSLELNEALINWFNPTPTYNDVVIRAANEAKGQGFVTEQAGSAQALGASIWQEWEETQWQEIQGTDWTGREGELLGRLRSFAQLDGMREVFSTVLTPPQGVSEEEFLGCVDCYFDFSQGDIEGLDPETLLAAVAEDVVEPMRDTQALFEKAAFSTRLYTTMSADEMTVDPMFTFNPDLPEVDNQHQADRIIECSFRVTRAEAPWRVELSGGVVRGTGNTWPFDPSDDEMPANAQIVRVGEAGEGEVVEDNREVIAEQLRKHNRTVPSSDGGCAASPGASGLGGGLALATLGMLGVAFWRRRRGTQS